MFKPENMHINYDLNIIYQLLSGRNLCPQVMGQKGPKNIPGMALEKNLMIQNSSI